jgi:hypothetical protein
MMTKQQPADAHTVAAAVAFSGSSESSSNAVAILFQ